MKKFLDLGSLAAIIIALFLIGYSSLPQRPAQPMNSTGAFKDFPVGQPRSVNLSARPEALEDLTPRERLEQARDWLLFTAVSASGLSAEEINKALFDLPPIRHGYMQPVANFEYGDVRSCYIGNGQVLALVPPGASDERPERLARIADEQRKNLGETPAKLLVFEYELQPDDDDARQTATLTRRDPINVKDLFMPSAGYYEAKINGPDDLKRFVGQVDDLTYASLKDGLTVGGRKIRGHDYRGIRVEEVAALYQSEAKIHAASNAFKQKIDDYRTRCEFISYRTEAEKEDRKQECAREGDALIEELRQERGAGRLVGSSGFSLDPTFDYAKLRAQFNSTIAPKIRSIMSGGALPNPQEDTQDLFGVPGLGGLAAAGDSVEQKIERAREGLAHGDADPLFELLGQVTTEGKGGADFAHKKEQEINKSAGYQAARYDGELRGTEAGMVLFYTDLIAKLWAINYQDSAPVGDVPGFSPMTALPVSSIYKQELDELSHTRLWFGPQEKGFQVADKGQSLLFARTATRVYAASSNPLQPGVETLPNAESAAFLGWWGDHYDEIARYEPEYERLNEIMKWSLVVTWLNQKGQPDKLNFLQREKVERDNWFPDWVKQHSQLRYQAWDKIGFFSSVYNGATTEALPRLKSETYWRFGVGGSLSGGVSLASEEKFAGRVALSAETKVEPVALRSNLDLGESTASTLKTFEGTSYSLGVASPGVAVTTTTAKGGAKLRGLYGEVANAPVERTVSRGGGGLSIGARLGDVPLGELTIGNAENGLSVGWASRDMDAGVSLGRQLSMSSEPDKLLALHPDVEAAIALPGGRGYFAKLGGSERWLKITPEGAPSASLEPGYAARVGDFDARAQNYNLTWVTPEEVSRSLSREGRTIRLSRVAGTDNLYRMEIDPSAPKGEPISIEHDGVTVRGTLDQATGKVSFAYDELPPALRGDPGLLRHLVTENQPSTEGGDRYVVGEFGKEGGMIGQLRDDDYRAAVRELVRAPDDFKTQLDLYRSASLDECKGMLLNKQYEMAGRRLDELIKIYGPGEELRLLKLVAELAAESDMLPSARDSLARLATQGNRPTMLDELSARLNQELRLGSKGEDVRLQLEGDDVVERYDLSDLAGGEALAPGEPNRLKAFIYVEDTPGLNNLDWHLSPQRTLDAAIAGLFKARVIRLPRGDIARLKPTVIYDKSEGITFKAADVGGFGGGLLRPRYFAGGGNPAHYPGGGFLPRAHGLTFAPCVDYDRRRADDDDCKDRDSDTVIVIVRQ